MQGLAEHLVVHMLRFVQVLRQHGITVTPQQSMTCLTALSRVNVLSKEEFFWACQATLISCKEDIPHFARLFAEFFKVKGLVDVVPELPTPPKKPKPRPVEASIWHNLHSPEKLPETEVPLFDRSHTASPEEVFKHKRFDRMDEAELEQAKAYLSRLRWLPPLRRSFRLQSSKKGKILHFRKTYRNALKHQGELLKFFSRDRKHKVRPLVVLADVSGSMERYSKMLLYFLHALSIQYRRKALIPMQVFTFGTRLTCITPLLKQQRIDQVLAEVGATVSDWSGGTRMGEALAVFNRSYAKRVLAGGAVVLIISDGWDTGDPALLAKEAGRLSRQAHRLMWMSPLLGTEGYQPINLGMQAVLPHVDDFLPVHNLQSLQQLAGILHKLSRV